MQNKRTISTVLTIILTITVMLYGVADKSAYARMAVDSDSVEVFVKGATYIQDTRVYSVAGDNSLQQASINYQPLQSDQNGSIVKITNFQFDKFNQYIVYISSNLGVSKTTIVKANLGSTIYTEDMSGYQRLIINAPFAGEQSRMDVIVHLDQDNLDKDNLNDSVLSHLYDYKSGMDSRVLPPGKYNLQINVSQGTEGYMLFKTGVIVSNAQNAITLSKDDFTKFNVINDIKSSNRITSFHYFPAEVISRIHSVSDCSSYDYTTGLQSINIGKDQINDIGLTVEVEKNFRYLYNAYNNPATGGIKENTIHLGDKLLVMAKLGKAQYKAGKTLNYDDIYARVVDSNNNRISYIWYNDTGNEQQGINKSKGLVMTLKNSTNTFVIEPYNQDEFVNSLDGVHFTLPNVKGVYQGTLAVKNGEAMPIQAMPANFTMVIGDEDKPLSNIPTTGESTSGNGDQGNQNISVITNPTEAVSAVGAAAKSIPQAAKTSVDTIDSLLLYTEKTLADSATKTVKSGNVVVSTGVVKDLASQVQNTKAAMEKELVKSGIELQRDIKTVVAIKSSEQSQLNVVVDRRTAVKADEIKIQTPFVEIGLDTAEIKAETGKNQLAFSVKKAGVNKVNITFQNNKTTTLKVSFPHMTGDTRYLAVVDKNGNAVGGKYNPVTMKLEAKIKKSGVYAVKKNQKSFGDIKKKSKEMQDAILMLAAKGILKGKTAKNFAPDDKITIAELVSYIINITGKLDANANGGFKDVKKSDWYYGVAGTAKKIGIVSGSTFSGVSQVQKDKSANLMSSTLIKEMRYRMPKNIEAYLKGYKDKSSFVKAVKPHIALVTRENVVVKRSDGKFMPKDRISRGDAAILLKKLFERMW